MMGKTRYRAKLVWLNAGFYTGLLVITAVCILFVTIPLYSWLRFVRGFDKGKSVRWIIWLYGRAWTKLLGVFVPLRIENCEKPLPQPCIVTPNHQSFFDTYCFGFTSSCNIVFAVRAWPFKMPFYGTYMRHAGYLNTEDITADDFLKQGKAILAQGASIGVFPEGTRSPDGNMRRFHAGAFHLAAETGVPVVPLCIEGTGIFLRKGNFLLRPTSISVRLLDPVWPRQLPASREELPLALRHTVKEQLQQALLELRALRTL